jgi:hypothetical protein
MLEVAQMVCSGSGVETSKKFHADGFFPYRLLHHLGYHCLGLMGHAHENGGFLMGKSTIIWV